MLPVSALTGNRFYRSISNDRGDQITHPGLPGKPFIHRCSPALANRNGSRQGHRLYRRPTKRKINLPEVAGLDRNLRIKIHQEYFHTILFRDLVERHDIPHPKAVSDLAHWLVDNASSLYSVNNLTGYLKSLGHKVPKSAVSDYLAWFEDAYFLFTVRIFDASLARSNTNPKKIYCVDHALVKSLSSGILVNSGHLLENLVFMALRRLYPEVSYFKTKTGREVDFVVPGRDRSRMLVQVCESLVETQTRKREMLALTEAMSELGQKTGTIVTKSEDERISTETGTIEVVPIWRFLLELPNQGSPNENLKMAKR